jgi:hypothetical protein
MLVVNQVVLRRYRAGVEVLDERDRGGVPRGDAEKLSSSGAGVPFWNFLPVLNARIEHEHGGPEDTRALYLLAADDDSEEAFMRGARCIETASVVENPHSVVQGKRPEVGIGLIGPVVREVEKHSAGHLRDSADGALSDAILVMGADSGEGNGLVAFCAVLNEIFGAEGAVVGVELLDGDACAAVTRPRET